MYIDRKWKMACLMSQNNEMLPKLSIKMSQLNYVSQKQLHSHDLSQFQFTNGLLHWWKNNLIGLSEQHNLVSKAVFQEVIAQYILHKRTL